LLELVEPAVVDRIGQPLDLGPQPRRALLQRLHLAGLLPGEGAEVAVPLRSQVGAVGADRTGHRQRTGGGEHRGDGEPPADAALAAGRTAPVPGLAEPPSPAVAAYRC